MVKNMLLLCLLSAIIIIAYIGIQKREYSSVMKETFQNNEATAEDTEAQAEDTEAPAEDTEAQAEDTEAPAEDTEAPAEDTEAQAEGNEVYRNINNECNFKAQGNTLSGCNMLCTNDNTLCTKKQCNKICHECYDTDCKWVTDSLKPHQPIISVRPLVNAIKVSWKRPKTEHKIIKYTIVLQKPNVNEEKTFYFPIGKGKTDINYEIVDLNSNDTYVVYAIATNRFGNSLESNRIIIKPLKKALSKNNKAEEKPIHELNFQRGEYEADDLKEVLKKVIEFKKFQDPYHIVARYNDLS